MCVCVYRGREQLFIYLMYSFNVNDHVIHIVLKLDFLLRIISLM